MKRFVSIFLLLWSPLAFANVDIPGPATFFVSTADGTQTGIVTNASIVGTGSGSKTIKGGSLFVSRTIEIAARGLYTTDGAPGNLTIKVRFGTTDVLTTGALGPTASVTNGAWDFRGLITIRTTGASGTVYAQGAYSFGGTTDQTIGRWWAKNTSTTTIDTTADQTIELTITSDDAGTTVKTNDVIYNYLR